VARTVGREEVVRTVGCEEVAASIHWSRLGLACLSKWRGERGGKGGEERRRGKEERWGEAGGGAT
jgi:hypothetical protein